MSEWISVKESLPINSVEDMGDRNFIDVLVIVTDEKYVWTEYFTAGNTSSFWKKFRHDNERITRWMPLPLPPVSSS
jgi:hypothetical protein